MNEDECTIACKLASCGDGFVQPGEECDEGMGNANNGACTLACTNAECGDGFVGPGEACDGGMLNADDAACTSSCQAATCGDGLVWAGVEACDDGNEILFDGCNPDCVLAGSPYGSEWEWEIPWPTGADCNGMWGTSGSDVWISQEYGVLLHYDGNEWTRAYPNPNTIYPHVFTGWSASPTDAWTGGHDQALLHWDGVNWTPVDSPAPGTINDIAGSSSDEIWAVGPNIPVMMWDGNDWSTLPTGFPYHHDVVVRIPGEPWVSATTHMLRLSGIWQNTGYNAWPVNDMYAVAPDDVWIASDDAKIWRWDGGSFNPQSGFGLPLTFDIDIIQGSSANSMWALDSVRYGIYGWNGTKWTGYYLNTKALGGVYSAAPDDTWACGQYGEIFHWNGAAWSQYNVSAVQNMTALADVDGELWAAGPTSVARQNGGAWQVMTPALAIDDSIVDIWGSDSNNVWVVGADNADNAMVWWWNGNQWFDVPAPGGWVYSVSGDDQGSVWIANTLDVFRWNGLAMEAQPIPDDGFRDVFALAPDDVWAVAGDRSWHFDGNTWSEVPVPNGYSILHIHGLASDDLWAAGTDALHWDGVSWQPTGLTPDPGASTCIHERSPTDVMACLSNNRIAHWDGLGWTYHDMPVGPRSITVSSGVTYCAAASDGILYQP